MGMLMVRMKETQTKPGDVFKDQTFQDPVNMEEFLSLFKEICEKLELRGYHELICAFILLSRCREQKG